MQYFWDKNLCDFFFALWVYKLCKGHHIQKEASFIPFQSWGSFKSGDMIVWNSSPIDRSHRPFLFPGRFRSRILATLKSYLVITKCFSWINMSVTLCFYRYTCNSLMCKNSPHRVILGHTIFLRNLIGFFLALYQGHLCVLYVLYLFVNLKYLFSFFLP